MRSRSDLLGLILDDVADELAAALEAAADSGDPAADLRAMFAVYREFATANPVAYALLNAPRAAPGATARAERSSVTLMRVITRLVGSKDALPAARMLVAWANGFIMMQLAGAFRLGGDVEEAWEFGIDRVLTAVQL